MKNRFLKIPLLYDWISINRLFSSDHPPLFLLYHTVNNVTAPYLLHVQYVKGLKEFESDLMLLQKYFCLVSLPDILSDKHFSKPPIHLTFDDGLKECHDIIAPVLKENNISATFFINPAFVENKDMSHRYKISYLISNINGKHESVFNTIASKLNVDPSKMQIVKKLKQLSYSDLNLIEDIAEILGIDFELLLKTEKPYMNLEQILKLQDEGFTIGAHGYDHSEYYNMSQSEQIADISKCVKWFVENIHPEQYYFAFPFTDNQVTKKFYSEIAKEYEIIFFGTAGLKHDPLPNSFQRIPLEYSGKKIDQVLKMEGFYYLLKKLTGGNILQRS